MSKDLVEIINNIDQEELGEVRVRLDQAGAWKARCRESWAACT